jgi:hypothetical protein
MEAPINAGFAQEKEGCAVGGNEVRKTREDK